MSPIILLRPVPHHLVPCHLVLFHQVMHKLVIHHQVQLQLMQLVLMPLLWAVQVLNKALRKVPHLCQVPQRPSHRLVERE